ncbi:MAG TPA: ribosome silencing factor, partial [Fimbriimonadaceae bacterium]|nr:ribosome silencing factor [Fimbriimonadaceae bacterium]
TSEEKLNHIVAAADELKAERIETLDVRGKTSVTDFFVVCSGTSDRHIASIADKVQEELTKLKSKPVRVEGENSGWVLQDYGDVVLNVMREETRQFYDLETLWNSFQTSPDYPTDKS